MRPIQLYLENFMSHEESYIDFTQFNSALIVGISSNSDLHSNGVGKTTIFKAIEYALFNEVDFSLEKIVRDDCQYAKVIFDFESDNSIYRVIRVRTKKSAKDFSLYRKDNDNIVAKDFDNKEPWQNLTCRRDSDTEKQLESIIKINFKSFQNTIHFIQRDISGLAVTSPEKRKQILKDALNLGVYAKLEKLAKDDLFSMEKNIASKEAVLETIGKPEDDIAVFSEKISELNKIISDKQNEIIGIKNISLPLEEERDSVKNNLNVLKSNYSAILNKKSSLENDISKYQTQANQSSLKIKQLVDNANSIKAEIESLKEKLTELQKTNTDTSTFEEQSKTLSLNIFNINTDIKSFEIKIKELQQPLPKEQKCKYCRNILTKEYLDQCKHDIEQDINNLQKDILLKKQQQTALDKELLDTNNKIKQIKQVIDTIASIDKDIKYKEKDILNKKEYYKELKNNVKSFETSIIEKKEELERVLEELNKYDKEALQNLSNKLNEINNKINTLVFKSEALNKEISALSSEIAVSNHKIQQANNNILKRDLLCKEIQSLNHQIKILPDIIEAFSSSGIPNLIIQNILDDLQSECNELLNQLKPGIQLCFYVEKTNTKGNQADTLDIGYFVNNRPRDFLQLSGAQRLAVSFSLKLGLSFMLHKLMGVNIKFLLLDEVDDSLDKASIDSFAEMVRTLERDYLILIITHNDRLKEKFGNVIVVEQDLNGSSFAKLK